MEKVTQKLEQTLRSCSQVIADFHRQEKGAFRASEQKEFAKCCLLYENEFLQYIQKVLSLIFDPALLSLQTGFTSSEILEQDLAALNEEFILEPISHLRQGSLIQSAENGFESEVNAPVPESSETLAPGIPEPTETLSVVLAEPTETPGKPDVTSSKVEDVEATSNVQVEMEEEVVFQLSDGEDEDITENVLQSKVLDTPPAPIPESLKTPPAPIPESLKTSPTVMPESLENPPAVTPGASEMPLATIPDPSEIPPTVIPESSEPDAKSSEIEDAEADPNSKVDMEEVVFHLSDGEEEEEPVEGVLNPEVP